MKLAWVFLSFAIVWSSLGLLSCSGDDDTTTPPPDDFDRRAMLVSLTDVVFIPAYGDLVTASSAFETEARAFCAAPDAAGLERVQDAWWETRGALKRTDAWAFGPYLYAPHRLGPKLDFWPVREDNVAEVLALTTPIDQAFLDTQGVATKGLPVAEYLLFDPVSGDGAALAAFDGMSGARRCAYVVAVSVDIVARANEMVTAWDATGDDFRGEVVDAGEGSLEFVTLHDAVSEVVSRMVFAVENIREMKIAEAQGKHTGGEPRPLTVESRYSDRSMADILDTLTSIETVYTGDHATDDGIGVQDFLLARRPDLDAAVLAAFQAVRAAGEAITTPLRVAVVEAPELVEALYQAVRDLHVLLGVDVAQALAVTVTFNDTDSD